MARRRKRRPHGGGQVVPPKMAGGTWGIRWREAGQRRFRGGYPNREVAERVLAKVTGDIAIGRAGLQRDPKNVETLGVLAEEILKRRDLTHRAAAEDRTRWNKHLKPHFGGRKPHEVDGALIRIFAETKLAEGLSPGTVRILIAILSAVYTDLVEQGITSTNPCRALPRSTRRLFRSKHDPRTTPFLEKMADVERIFATLPEPLNIAFAIGAFAGLRTGEVFALKWEHVDLAARRIHVRESVRGPLKDKDSRVVGILDPLQPVLTAWKLKSGGKGLVVPPLRSDGKKIDKGTPGKFLRAALSDLGLSRPGLDWYECTRHTFASQWVMQGGSIEKLKEMMGHWSVQQTEVYNHLRTDLFTNRDLGTIKADLGQKGAVPVPIGQRLGSGTDHGGRNRE